MSDLDLAKLRELAENAPPGSILTIDPADGVELLGRLDRAETALQALVELKDGPRDENYRMMKPVAWELARQVLVARGDQNYAVEFDETRRAIAQAAEAAGPDLATETVDWAEKLGFSCRGTWIGLDTNGNYLARMDKQGENDPWSDDAPWPVRPALIVDGDTGLEVDPDDLGDPR